jgi:hypothetical protein
MRLTSLIRFETGRRLHPTRLALPFSVFLAIHWIGAGNGLDSDGLFGYAFLAALGMGLQPDLRGDADRGFSSFCAVSLAGPRLLASARLASWVAWTLLLGVWSLVCTSIVPGGLGLPGREPALVFTLLGIVLLPAASAVDRWAGLRLPLMTVYLAAVAAGLLTSALGGDPAWVLAGPGIESVLAGDGDLMPLAARVPVALILAWAVFLEAPVRRPRSGPRWRPARLAIGERTAMVDFDLHQKRHGPGTRTPSELTHRRLRDRPGLPAHLPGMGSSASAPRDGPPPG